VRAPAELPVARSKAEGLGCWTTVQQPFSLPYGRRMEVAAAEKGDELDDDKSSRE
jgi:hypothetical protein